MGHKQKAFVKQNCDIADTLLAMEDAMDAVVFGWALFRETDISNLNSIMMQLPRPSGMLVWKQTLLM